MLTLGWTVPKASSLSASSDIRQTKRASTKRNSCWCYPLKCSAGLQYDPLNTASTTSRYVYSRSHHKFHTSCYNDIPVIVITPKITVMKLVYFQNVYHHTTFKRPYIESLYFCSQFTSCQGCHVGIIDDRQLKFTTIRWLKILCS